MPDAMSDTPTTRSISSPIFACALLRNSRFATGRGGLPAAKIIPGARVLSSRVGQRRGIALGRHQNENLRWNALTFQPGRRCTSAGRSEVQPFYRFANGGYGISVVAAVPPSSLDTCAAIGDGTLRAQSVKWRQRRRSKRQRSPGSFSLKFKLPFSVRYLTACRHQRLKNRQKPQVARRRIMNPVGA